MEAAATLADSPEAGGNGDQPEPETQPEPTTTKTREPRDYIVFADQGDGLTFHRVGGDDGKFKANRATDALADATEKHREECVDDDGEWRWLMAVPATAWNPKRPTAKLDFTG